VNPVPVEKADTALKLETGGFIERRVTRRISGAIGHEIDRQCQGIPFAQRRISCKVVSL
jgi:hypothetical protein